jgi:hypothetical protein
MYSAEGNMVATVVTAFRITPGKADEFRQFAGAIQGYLDGFGGHTYFRRTLFGGEAAREVSMITAYADPIARAEATDKVLAEVANNPLGKALDGADPPATLLRRSTLNGVGATALVESLPPAKVASIRSFQTSETNRPAAIAAMEASREQAAGLDEQVFNFQILGGGLAAGRLVRTVVSDSMAGLVEAARKRAEAGGPDPLSEAITEGTLTEISAVISILYPI